MTVLGEAFIAIRPQSSGFEAELQKDVVPGAQRVAKTLATAIGGAFVAGKIKSFVAGGIEELKAAAAVQAQTAAAIKSTGAAANVTEAQVGELSGQLLKLSGTDDELIQKGANLLLTFTGVRNEVGKGNDIFNQATKAALDLSTAGFGSMESASVLLGKALNDPVQGLTALQRVGVRLTDDQKELVRQLVATGDTLGAQKVILEEVNRQVGGSAEAYGKTLPGQIAIAQQSMENLKGTLAGSLAPALQVTAGFATSFAEQFAKQPEILQQVEGGLFVVVGGLASILTPLKSGIDLWRSFSNTAKAAGTAADISGAVHNSSTAVDGLYTKTGPLNTRLGGLARTAGGLVGSLGLLAGAISLLGIEADHANIPSLTDDLLDLVSSGKVSGEVASALGDDLGKLADAVERVAAPSVQTRVFNTFDGLNRVLGDTDDPLSNARAKIEDLDAALVSLGQQDPASAAAALEAITSALDPQTAERLLGLLDGYNDQVQVAATSSRLASRSITGIDHAAKGAAGSVDGLTDSTDEFTEKQVATESASNRVRTALDKQRAAMDELLGTTKTAITSQLDYADAQDASEDALAGLVTLTNEGKRGTEEYERAVGDAARTLLAQSEAAADSAEQQAALAGKTLDATEKARIQQTELQNLANTLAPNNPLRKQLEGFIFTLGQVTPRHTTVTANTAQAQAEIDKVLAKLAEWDRKARELAQNPLIFGGGSITARDHAIGSARGGLVPSHLALGGFPGGPMGSDTIPTWLTPGEFVMQRSAVDRLGVGLLSALNQGRAPAVGAGTGEFTIGQLVVQGATVEGAYATASETVRQLQAERFRTVGAP